MFYFNKNNSYKISNASKIKIFKSSEEYFSSLKTILIKAKERIFISGWDFDPRIKLIRKENELKLDEFLDSLCKNNKNLEIFISIWDAPYFFDTKRQAFKSRILNKHPMIHIEKAKTLPPSSLHEKYVVIDNKHVFTGGIDLAKDRWDTYSHHRVDPRRINPDKKSYIPYIDVQAILSGEIVKEFEALACSRWKLYHNKNLKPLTSSLDNEQANNYKLSLSLTRDPNDITKKNHKEIKKTYFSLISNAKKYIYIENQFFTHPVVLKKLRKKLIQKNGPLVIIILREDEDNLFEEISYNKVARFYLNKLKKSDKYSRLRVYNTGHIKPKKLTIKVHSKVIAIDDEYISLGSANISRRSFDYDNELNITIKANIKDNLIKQFMKNKLNEFSFNKDISYSRESNLLNIFDSFTTENSILKPFKFNKKTMFFLPFSSLIDPEEKNPVKKIFYTLVNKFKNFIFNQFTLSFLIICILIFISTYFYNYFNISLSNIKSYISGIDTTKPYYIFFITFSVFLLATLSTVIPTSVLIISFSMLIGVKNTILYSLTSLTLLSLLYFLIGYQSTKKRSVDEIRFKKLKNILISLKKYPTLASFFTHLIPSAPFIFVNFFSGIVKLPIKNFILGSFLGLAPGVFLLSFFGDRAFSFVKNLSTQNTIYLIISLTMLIIFIIYLNYLNNRWKNR